MMENTDPHKRPVTSVWSLDSINNVGHTLTETARHMPLATAVACPAKSRYANGANRFETINFEQLEKISNQIAAGVRRMGILPGERIALLVPPGIDFVAHVFGLFKAGVVIILIDPGMGKKNMIGCLADAEPKGMVGVARAHLARTLFRHKFKGCRKNIVLGHWPGCIRSKRFLSIDPASFEPADVNRESEAAIIFTTGSTGPPKGVLYRHRVFIEQARQIRDYFHIVPGSTDVSGFPLFALFNTAMGTTTVFPRMDATRPADVHPPDIIDAVNYFDADQSFGSPALWNTVSNYCVENSVSLPGLKRILTAGAPVPANVLSRIKSIIHPDGEAFTPYGATEALPVACNSATEIIHETSLQTENGAGTCVGNRFPDIRWKIIEITDKPITHIDNCRTLPVGEVGEIIVQGPVVTDRYVTRTEANLDHKISDGERFWHRMGDVGYLDEQDRFWFCGRKAHRVVTPGGTMFTIPCEGIINTHPSVYRSALVGVGIAGEQMPVMIVEPARDCWPTSDREQNGLIQELRETASQHWQTNQIEHFRLYRSLPVDIRHNSKIFREQLSVWATDQLSAELGQGR